MKSEVLDMKGAGIGIIAHSCVERGIVQKILESLEKKNKSQSVYLDPIAAEKTGRKATAIRDMKPDLAIVIGGDGTILWAVNSLKGNPRILGVNTGRVGFLTEIDSKAPLSWINELYKGRYHIEERSQLKVNGRYEALNELVILPQKPAQLLEFAVWIDGESLTDFRADGLVISTPTGSTGHALSVGGPIIHPGARVYLIAPLVPFMREQPPIIIPASSKIEIEVVGKERDAYMILDGHTIKKLKHSEKIFVEESDVCVGFIRFRDELKKQKRRWNLKQKK